MDINIVFDKGEKLGIEDMEVYIKSNSSTGFRIYEGNVEGYTIEEEEVLSIRGIYKGRMGYSYTEKLKESSIDELLNNLIQYAENNESEYIEELAASLSGYGSKKANVNRLNEYTDEQKIEFLKSIEKEALDSDERIKAVSNCNYKEITTSVLIKNTKGLELEDSHNIGILRLSVVAENEEDIRTGYSHMVIDDLSDDYKKILIEEAVSDATNLLGATTIDSGKYQVILRNNVAATIFGTMAQVFKGDLVQRNLSMMKGKLEKKIAVEELSIVEDPLFKKGLICRTFDDEGTPTYKKYIVENGILKTFLHNKRTSKQDGAKSTGNGFRISHKTSIEVLPTNLYIEKGNISLDDMISSIGEGVLITDVEGAFAGINAVSGDISLLSNGLLIRDGKAIKPLCQITISGNFFEMIRNISAIGSDLKFSYPDIGNFGSPSLRIDGLTIAGS